MAGHPSLVKDSNERDPKDGGKDSQEKPTNLSGTTLKVYRYIYRNGSPIGIREIQRGIGLSSPSVAEYHVRKLVEMGLVREEQSGSTPSSRYLVDRRVFENMIRIRRTVIPMQIGFSVFFATGFLLLLFLLRPRVLSSEYAFALVMVGLGCAIFGYQALSSMKSNKI